MIRRLRRPGPELIVMGLLALVCGVALAEVLSAEFGAQSSGPPAALKTVTTPAADLGKLRQTASRAASAQRAKRHKRVHRAKRRHAPSPARPAAPPTVAQVQVPASTQQAPTPYYQQSSPPVQQLSAPSNPAPVQTAPKRTAPRPKPKPVSGGGSFDDSG